MSRETWSATQRWKNDAIYLAARAAIGLGLTLPRSWLPRLGSALGLAAYALFPRARRVTHHNLALVHPGVDDRARAALARRIFRSLGQSLTDTAALLDPTEVPGRTLRMTDDAQRTLEAALAEGRGVVYATCHLGPWERMAALLAQLGYPITTVARESYDERFHHLLYEKIRTMRNVEIIYRGNERTPLSIVRALRKGRVVGFLADLPGRIATQPVEWLGRSARIALGPARIALRTGSVVVVGTPAPGDASGAGLHVRIERLPTHDLPPGEPGEAMLCQRMADALTERIRALPAQWPWMHPSFGPPMACHSGRSARHFRLVEWWRGHFH